MELGLRLFIGAASALLWASVRLQKMVPESAPDQPFALPDFEPLLPFPPGRTAVAPAEKPPPAAKPAPRRVQIEPLAHPDHPVPLPTMKAVLLFVRWAQGHGEANRHFTAQEIDHMVEQFFDSMGVIPIPLQTVRSELKALGLCLERKQLALEHQAIKHRTRKVRAVLYTIPPRGWRAHSQASLLPEPDRDDRVSTGRPPAVRPSRDISAPEERSRVAA